MVKAMSRVCSGAKGGHQRGDGNKFQGNAEDDHGV